MNSELIKSIIEDKTFQKVLGGVYVYLRLNGMVGNLKIEYRRYQGDGSSEFQGVYTSNRYVGGEALMNSSMDTLIGYIYKIVEHFDDDAEFDFEVDYDEVSFEEYSFIFDFKQKEFEIIHYYSYYDTNYTTSEKEFDDISGLAKEEINEFCSANKMFKVSFAGSGDSGYIESDGVNEDDEKFDLPGGLEDVFYDMLSNYGGWEINEGSQGDFTIDCNQKVIILEFGENYEKNASNDVFKSELNYELSRPQR